MSCLCGHAKDTLPRPVGHHVGFERRTSKMLFFFLEKRYPKDFAKMLAQVEKYASAKEAMNSHDGSPRNATKKKKG